MNALNEQFAAQQGAFKKQTATTSGDLITGVSVPVSIDRNGAKLRMQVQLNPSVLDNPQTLNAVLDLLEQSFDLDVWKPSGGSDSGNGFKRGNSGGYNNGNNYNKRW
jgi:hypothetical protein